MDAMELLHVLVDEFDVAAERCNVRRMADLADMMYQVATENLWVAEDDALCGAINSRMEYLSDFCNWCMFEYMISVSKERDCE